MERQTSRRRWLSVGLFAATTAGLVIALREASKSVGAVPWPSTFAIAAALVLVVTAMLFAAASWAVLLAERGDRATLARGFVYGQLGKYVPGGVVQYARLYEYARKAGVEPHAVAVGMPVHAFSAILAPSAVASIALGATATHLSLTLRVLAAVLGLLGLMATTFRPLTAVVLDVLSARWARLPASDSIPSQRSIANTFLLGLVSSACFGAAYATLLGQEDFHVFVVALLSFLVASAVGFVALPFPSGIGIREAVLTALLFDVAPVAELLTAAIALRIIQVAVDVTLAGGAALGPVLSRLDARRRTAR